MQLDPEQPIHGFRPSVLKTLFRRERFDTPRVMTELGLDEPAATNLLMGLAEEGWIGFDESADGVDVWETKGRGRRLAASPLIKRITAAQAREIIEKVVKAAADLNRNPDVPERITAVYLFGSALTADESASIGDVDLVVDTGRRKLPKEELERLRRAAIPEGSQLAFLDRLRYSEMLLLRGIKRASRSVSLHARSDLESLGVPYRQIYAYDLTRECEVPFDASIRQFPGDRQYLAAAEAEGSSVALPPVRERRAWPADPKLDRLVSIDAASARLAQHLWTTGCSIEHVAARTRVEADMVLSYLAHRPLEQNAGLPEVMTGLDATIAPFVPIERDYSLMVHLTVGRAGYAAVEVKALHHETYKSRGGLIALSRSEYRVNRAEPALIPVLEGVARAAIRWQEKMRGRVEKPAAVIADVFLFPDNVLPEGDTGRLMDFRALAQPLLATFESAWPPPRSEREAYYTSAELSFDTLGRFGVYLARDEPGQFTKRRRVLKRFSAQLLPLAAKFQQDWSACLGRRAGYTLVINGTALTYHEDDYDFVSTPDQKLI